MAFPFVFAEGFELGTRGNFDAETDTAAILDFPHYTTLARQGMTPFRGAYCMRIRLTGGTTSAYVQENASFDDLTANVQRWLRFYFYLGRDFVMADSDLFTLVEIESVADSTTEVACGIDRSGDLIRWFYGETGSTQSIVLGSVARGDALGKWFCAELAIDLDNAGANDGTITGYINDVAGTQITALDQGVIVDAKFGVIGPDAGTSGTVLIDDIVYDDGRLYARQERWPTTEVSTYSEHVFVGPGAVESAQLLSAESDDQIRLYDTDNAEVNDPQGFLAELNANTDLLGPFNFKRGCYASLSGTNPRGQLVLSQELNGPQCRDNSSIINHGLRRKVKRFPV